LKKEKDKKAPDRKEVHLFRLFHYFMGGERTWVMKKEARFGVEKKQRKQRLNFQFVLKKKI
jgi:uncharacterized Tic20 family protein